MRVASNLRKTPNGENCKYARRTKMVEREQREGGRKEGSQIERSENEERKETEQGRGG